MSTTNRLKTTFLTPLLCVSTCGSIADDPLGMEGDAGGDADAGDTPPDAGDEVCNTQLVAVGVPEHLDDERGRLEPRPAHHW